MKKRSKNALLLMSKLLLYGLLLQLFLVEVLYANDDQPQRDKSVYDIHISLSKDKYKLEEILKEIEGKTDFHFTYDDSKVRLSSSVWLGKKEGSLGAILVELSKLEGIKFKRIGKNIHISRKKEAESSIIEQAALIQPMLVVEGQVTSQADGVGLPGVNVLVKGTSTGTVTDIDGNYNINVSNEDDILVFSSIGYTTQEVPVNGRTTIDIAMAEDVQSLQEVVVTALGVGKDSKSITYATQKVESEEITRVKDVNFMNTLAGKVAGAVITKGNFGPGSSPRILLRGNKSLTGNSAPLYVLNGVPMFGGSDLLSNINPEDIESVQVLKGASAAALYGSEAANGVILVSTKKGREGVAKIDFSSTFTLEDAVYLPELQTTYGQADPNFNDSWGPKITNGSDSHLKEFFETGKNYINAISFSNGNDLGQMYLSYANTTAQGILPENDLTQHNFTLRLTTQFLNEKLSLDGSVNYTNQKIYNQNSAGGYSALPGIYSFPTGDDFSKYSGDNFEVWDPVRQMNVQNWPYIRNETFPNQNPYWVQKRNQRDFFRDHTIFSFTANYEILDWLDIQGRATYDKINDESEFRYYASTQATVAGPNGGYGIGESNISNLYSDILLIGNKIVNENFSVSATLGLSHKEITTSGLNLSSTVPTSLSFPNYFSVYALNGLFNKSESLRKSLTQAAFGNATVGYKERVFLDVTGRNEWSSTVSQPFFYPSVGLSYVLTNDSENTGAGLLSFAKVRGSYAEVGNSLPFGIANWAPPYSLDNSGNINARGALPYFSGTDTTNLRPERTKSFEFGTELRLLNDKLSLNLTYYNATTYDQVFQIQAPAGAGAANFWINGGIIRNRGIEGVLTYNAGFGNLKWAPSVSFSHNQNQIRQLSDLLEADRFVLTSFNQSRLVAIYLTRPKDGEYGAFGDLFGRIYQRDENGNMMTNDEGLPLVSETPDHFIGNANPDFLAGFNNTFTYKNVSLSFLIDGRFGGGVVNRTELWLDYKGLSKRTGEARDNGGVMVNGKLIDAKEYYLNQTGAGASAVASEYFYDATNIRLRELAIGYTLPELGNVVRALNLSLVGRNLFFFYKNAPFDPEISVNTSPTSEGLASFTMPSTRSFGLTLRAIF